MDAFDNFGEGLVVKSPHREAVAVGSVDEVL
jgi:hypothetical protein